MAKRILKKYCIKGIRKIRYRKGHGVHSPFAFALITKVIEERFMYYSYNEIETFRMEHLKKKLMRNDLRKRKNISFKTASLLFRLVNYFKPSTVLEVASSWGISSLYLNAGNPKSSHICVEPDTRIAEVTAGMVQNKAITILNAPLEQGVKEAIERLQQIDFAFIHKLSVLSRYPLLMKKIEAHRTENAVIVLEGIHANTQMLKLWKELIQSDQVRVSMDLYDLGLLFYNTKLNKQNYVVYF